MDIRITIYPRNFVCGGYIVPSLFEIGQVVLEKKIFKSCQFIFFNSQLSPFWEGRGPSFEQTWIPFTQGSFVPSLVEIGPVVLEKMKMWKVYRRTDGRTDRQTTDDRWSEKLTWAFSSVALFTEILTINYARKRKLTNLFLFTKILTRLLACKMCRNSTTVLTLS